MLNSLLLCKMPLSNFIFVNKLYSSCQTPYKTKGDLHWLLIIYEYMNIREELRDLQ